MSQPPHPHSGAHSHTRTHTHTHRQTHTYTHRHTLARARRHTQGYTQRYTQIHTRSTGEEPLSRRGSSVANGRSPCPSPLLLAFTVTVEFQSRINRFVRVCSQFRSGWPRVNNNEKKRKRKEINQLLWQKKNHKSFSEDVSSFWFRLQ